MAIGDMTLREFLNIQTYYSGYVKAPVGLDSRLVYTRSEGGNMVEFDPLECSIDDLSTNNNTLYGTLNIPYAMASSQDDGVAILYETDKITEDTDSYYLSILFPRVLTAPSVLTHLYELKDGYIQMGVYFTVAKEGK